MRIYAGDQIGKGSGVYFIRMEFVSPAFGRSPKGLDIRVISAKEARR